VEVFENPLESSKALHSRKLLTGKENKMSFCEREKLWKVKQEKAFDCDCGLRIQSGVSSFIGFVVDWN
jgi:hypothetical protein